MRFTFGKHVSLLPPGVHWFFPGLQEIEAWVVVYQSADCGQQPLETADGISFTVSVNIDYTIADAVKMRTEYQDFDTTLVNMARGMIGEWCLQRSYAELKENPKDMMEHLKGELRKRFAPAGIRIKEVRRDVFTRAKPYNVMGIGSALLT